MTAVTDRDGSRATGLTITGQRRLIHNRDKTCLPVNEAASRSGGARINGDGMATNHPAMAMPAMAMKSEPASGAIRGKTAAADISDEQIDSC
ncbi:MAG: hypothetical protein K2X52_13290 [Mycobacteriaceae bacterium]|nr:hypothetical protein [Mycobacteriaceae bacterium]